MTLQGSSRLCPYPLPPIPHLLFKITNQNPLLVLLLPREYEPIMNEQTSERILLSVLPFHFLFWEGGRKGVGCLTGTSLMLKPKPHTQTPFSLTLSPFKGHHRLAPSPVSLYSLSNINKYYLPIPVLLFHSLSSQAHTQVQC